MIYLQLFFEFFKAGLFAIGGGLAIIPFLTDIGQRTGWFTSGELANMIAISESTPGPMGVNMATYVGFHTGGIAGGVIATLGLVCPSILVILVIAGFLKKFRESRGVDAVFYGIRPASTALIAAALAEVCSIALLNLSAFQTGGAAALFQWKGIALAVVIFVCLQVKPLKKLHPIVFIAASAVIGAVYNGVTGYFGDILSYSRLMVMMLAGSVIGQVFNILGAMPGGGLPPAVGIPIFFVIFIVGHAFNIGLNVIGTYVHTSRLQYLEFFKQFYKEGGRPWRPLNIATKFVDIKEEQ